LIETALGDRSQYVVAAAGPELPEELVRDPFRFAGRVGFLWLDEGHPDPRRGSQRTSHSSPTGRDPRTSSDPATEQERTTKSTTIPDDLTGLPGVVDRADRLIDTDAEYRPLAERLLGRTWIVESLEDAVDLASDHTDCKFVTYTGEVLDTDGSVVVGPRNVSSGLISRRSELRELRASCALTGERITEMESQIREVDRQIALAEGRGEELAGIHRQAVEEQSRHAHRITAANERAKQLERQIRSLSRDLHRAHQNREEATAALREAGERRQWMESELERMEGVVATMAGEIETLELRHERLSEITTEARIEVAKVDEVERNLESRRAQLASSRMDHQRSVATCVEQIELYRQRFAESERTILAAETELAMTYRNRERSLSEAASLIAEHDRNLAHRAELAGSAHRYRSRMRRLEEKIRQCELVVGQTRMSLTSLRERFREDFDRDLTEITEEDLMVPGDASADSSEDPDGTERTTDQEVMEIVDGSESPENTKDTEGSAISGNRDWSEDSGEELVQDPDFSDPDAVGKRSGEGCGTGSMAGPKEGSRESRGDGESPENERDRKEDVSERIGARREEMQREIESLRRKLQSLGSVNQESLEELDALEERHTELDREYRDLLEAKSHLEKILERIDADSRRIFLETVETIRGHFRKLYQDLFGGGRADILLDPEIDPLESGIEIVARPPGKQLRNLTLLSGGEKTMTCVALLLALFRSHPGPFCILDEVDAALDESNVGLFTEVLNEFQDRTQFIMISHSKRSMAAAATLHGVTMQEPGVSRRISVRFEDVSDDG
ncbi:MAG: AAA family ATPase, partial [Planctomycetia bacterium]|nr:AAA family ATPase [Planctomycetia bacterium]